ncbi:MAG: serine hydrolase domain-containing protein [Ruminococcus sp.]|nr:serine hydrolase domain-containing protein [Ruminococcus difficilis]MEE0872606.1 serine hydrolase domain-containing protein [Ruminococcus sp.]
MICNSLSVGAATNKINDDTVDEYLQTCVENAHIPALSITIVNKDNVLFSSCYGECDDCDTPFVLGSVSKSFTAVCVMQLIEQGKINLDEKISAYLPNAADGDKITVSQLLNHTGGLGEHQTLENFHIINEQGEHHYANVNYSLLGKIIEKVSGLSYEEYVTKNIFEPLDLSHTAATQKESINNGLIDGYTDFWGFQLKRSHKYPTSENAWITVPAGYLSSSTNDLGRYLQMYLNGGEDIISKQSIDKMFYGDTVYVEDDVPFWYGYGWATVKEPLSEPVLRHSGLVETGTSCVFILPESGLGVAITTNVNDYFVTNEMMDSLGWGVILMLLGESPNEIADNAYLLNHLRIDLIMIAVFAVAVLPLCFLIRYRKSLKKNKKVRKVITLVIYHLILPIFILLVVPVFFQTPLWVAEAFVPDVFITVVLSSTMLFVTGVIKSIMLIHNIRVKQKNN